MSERPFLARRLAAAAVAMVVVAIVAFGATRVLGGGDGEDFTAASFIRAVNERGGRVSLGSRLFSQGGRKEVWAITLSRDRAIGEEEGGASISVFDGTGAAVAELDRCRSTGVLLCIRADNVVIALEQDARGAGVRRLVAALARMGGGSPRARRG